MNIYDIVIDKATKLIEDSNNRVAGQGAANLSKGLFYPRIYYEKLLEGGKKNEKRLNWLRDKHAFSAAYVSPQHFSRIFEKPLPVKVSAGVLPSNAIKAAKVGLSLFGCVECCQLAQWLAVETFLGKDRFNAVFASDLTSALIFGAHQKNPLHTLTLSNSKTLQRAQIIHIFNSRLYIPKNPLGEWCGFQLICIDATPGHTRFIGFGIPSQGLVYQEIIDLLLNEYNKPPANIDHLQSETASMVQRTKEYVSSLSLRDHTITMDEFKSTGGGQTTIISEFNLQRLEQLRDCPIEEALTLMAAWMQELM